MGKGWAREASQPQAWDDSQPRAWDSRHLPSVRGWSESH